MTQRYTDTPRRPPEVMETTVFQSGNSQAVRIPKEFQLDAQRVEIVRDGHQLVLRPLAHTAADALLDLPPLSGSDAAALDHAMAQVDDLLPLDEPIR
ncbi:antitoxin [Hydrogenophaga sp. R2]|uniref:antitoxin n=1 Tax=Hydrogenophaga sp. R2 TaxID=3132827 RepID=UPI003CED5D96